MKTKLYRGITFLLLIIWMALIFSLSAQNASESSDTGAGFAYRLFSVFYPGFSSMTSIARLELIAECTFYIRKAAHFSLYFILGVFSFLSVISYRNIGYYLRVIISFAICVLYAASDEIHQSLVPGRSGELRDVLIDSIGALCSVLLLLAATRLRHSLYSRLNSQLPPVPGYYRSDKMRKKELWEQNASLFDRLQESELDNQNLRLQLKEANDEIERLKNIIFAISDEDEMEQAQIDAAEGERKSAEASSLKPEPEIIEPLPQQAEEAALKPTKTSLAEEMAEAIAEEPEAIIPEPTQAFRIIESPSASIAHTVAQPDMHEKAAASSSKLAGGQLEYASSVIGKIVVNAANYSNRLTAGGETRYRELVNLILGKTEVAKSEILSIVTGGAEPELQRQAVNSVYEQACEYFESVMAQKE